MLWLALVVLAVAIVLLLAARRPDTFRVERSTDIAASPGIRGAVAYPWGYPSFAPSAQRAA